MPFARESRRSRGRLPGRHCGNLVSGVTSVKLVSRSNVLWQRLRYGGDLNMWTTITPEEDAAGLTIAFYTLCVLRHPCQTVRVQQYKPHGQPFKYYLTHKRGSGWKVWDCHR
ncbi:hypothetical protein Brsp06_04437 [Brucella sp. NBRC 13694]